MSELRLAVIQFASASITVSYNGNPDSIFDTPKAGTRYLVSLYGCTFKDIAPQVVAGETCHMKSCEKSCSLVFIEAKECRYGFDVLTFRKAA